MNVIERRVDVLVIGGGTAGPMAAEKARQAHPGREVLLLEKANVKRSGAIAMGMDGLNNAVVPGHASPSSTCARSPRPTTASSTRPRCWPARAPASR